MNAVFNKMLFIKESWQKKEITFHKNIKQHNIDNNRKYLLSTKSAHKYDFKESSDTEDTE